MNVQILSDRSPSETGPPPPSEKPGMVIASVSNYAMHRCNPFATARYMVSGSMKCVALGRELIIREGELLIVGAGTAIDVATNTHSSCDGISISIDPAYFGALDEAPLLKVDPGQFMFGKIIENISQDMNDFLSGQNIERLYQVENVLHQEFGPMVQKVIDEANRIQSKSLSTSLSLYEKIQMARKVLCKDFRGAKKLDDIAIEVGVSKHHLSRIFKDVYGIAPIIYRDMTRLQRAKNDLLNGSKAQDIAERFGYADLPSFSKAFKRSFGVPPSIVQKNRSA